MKDIEITDEKIANILDMTAKELAFLKEKDAKSYEVFRFGAMCKVFDLSEEDLLHYIKSKQHTDKDGKALA